MPQRFLTVPTRCLKECSNKSISFLLRPASDQALETFQKQSLAPDVVSTTIPNSGMERGETSKMFFNLHPALCSASKSFLNTCLVLYLVTIIVVKCKHPLPLFRSSVRKFLKQVWYFARLFVLWRSAEGTLARKKSKQVLFFRSLIRTFAFSYAEASIYNEL